MNGNKEECKEVSMHKLDHAFTDIDMGGISGGIFTGIPPHVLHVVCKGKFESISKSIIDNLTVTMKNELDNLAAKFNISHCQRYCTSYPKNSFTGGLTNLSHITANEWVGIVFLLVILSQYAEEWKCIEGGLPESTEMEDVVQYLEALLCFDAWLHLDCYWRLQDKNEFEKSALTSIQALISMLKQTFPEQCNCPKFHLLLHIPYFISKFGPPKNYDAQLRENSHIEFAKHPGCCSHKNFSNQSFEKQVASDALIQL